MKVPLSPDREGALLEWNVGGTQGSDPRSTRELSPRGFKHTRQKRDGAGDGARNARSQVAPDLKQSQRNRRASDDPQEDQRDRQTQPATCSLSSTSLFLLAACSRTDITSNQHSAPQKGWQTRVSGVPASLPAPRPLPDRLPGLLSAGADRPGQEQCPPHRYR